MNSKLMAALACAAIATSASAQKATAFPPMLTPQKAVESTSNGMMRAPLNPNAGKGTHIYGVTILDYDQGYHFFDMWSNTPSQLNKSVSVLRPDLGDNEDYPNMYAMAAGTANGKGEWYGYKVRIYSFETRVDSWVKANPYTGEYDKLADLEPKWDQWAYTVDMAWNPVDDQIYALAQSDVKSDLGGVTSKILLIDPETGEVAEETFQLPDYYFCMAYNYDGELYAIRWVYNSNADVVGTQLDIFDSNDNYELIQSKTLTVDNKAFRIYYQNALTIDYTTGDLWWGAVDASSEQCLVKIDPQKLTTQNMGKVGFSEIVLGLNIPFFTADSRTAPAQVSDLNFTVDPNGANKVTLSWTNPSKRWNLGNLNSIAEVLVYRDSYQGTPVATLTGTTPGATMSWTDENATQGVHKYYVTACAKSGEKGVPAELEAYVGRDVPGPVNNLLASTPEGKTIDLSWTAPTRGDSDGWFDTASVEYRITRLPDNKDLGTTKSTSFTDSNIPEAQAYSYVVTPFNVDGNGTPTTSNEVLAGQSIVIPFSTKFENAVEASRFTSIDKNHDGTKWEYDFNLNKPSINSMYLSFSDYGCDDVLVSPPLTVKKGTTYRVIYHMSFGGYGSSDRVMLHQFKFIGGTEATEEGLTDEYEFYEDFRTESIYDNDVDFMTYFTAPVDGEYFFGLDVVTPDEHDAWMFVEAFSIDEAPANDLEAAEFKSHLLISNTDDNEFNVRVYNNGSATAEGYKVQMAYLDSKGEPQVFAENANTPSVASHQSANVVVKGHPEGLAAGKGQIVAIVAYDKDGNPNNDMTAAVELDVDEAPALNATVTSDEPYYSTHLPMNHYSAYTASQTIYTPEMLNLKSFGKKVEISRVAFEYIASTNIDATDVELYLGMTDKKGFVEGDLTWTPAGATPDFSGTLKIEDGTHYMTADLNDTFELDTDRGLILTVSKYEALHADWIVRFATFDGNWTNDLFHSLYTSGAAPIDVNSMVSANREPDAPVLHLSLVGDGTGVDEVVVAGSAAYWFNNRTGMLNATNADLTSIDVYDFSGRLVRSIPAVGQTQIKVDAAAGMYILRLNKNGQKAASLKVKVNG